MLEKLHFLPVGHKIFQALCTERTIYVIKKSVSILQLAFTVANWRGWPAGGAIVHV